MKKLIKENKILLCLTLIIMVSLVLICVGLISYFYGNNKDPYGDRLRDKNKYPISETINNDIKSIYKDEVKKVNVDVKGKIVYVIMDVKDGVSVIDAQGYAVKALDKFKSEELSYYDIQFMITCEDEKVDKDDVKVYPIMGAKKATASQIVWTKN